MCEAVGGWTLQIWWTIGIAGLLVQAAGVADDDAFRAAPERGARRAAVAVVRGSASALA